MVAGGVIDLSSDVTDPSIEDPEIGTVKLYAKIWDSFDDSGKSKLEFREIKTEFCKADDLNDSKNSNQKSKFYPATEQHE